MTTQQEALRGVIQQLGDAALRITHAATAAHESQVSANFAIGTLASVQRDVEQIHGLYIAALAIHRSMPRGEK